MPKRKQADRRQQALWLVSVVVVASMVCGSLVMLVPPRMETPPPMPTPTMWPTPTPTVWPTPTPSPAPEP